MTAAGYWEWAMSLARQPGQYLGVAGGICAEGHGTGGRPSRAGGRQHSPRQSDCKTEKQAHRSPCRVVGEAGIDASVGRDAR